MSLIRKFFFFFLIKKIYQFSRTKILRNIILSPNHSMYSVTENHVNAFLLA